MTVTNDLVKMKLLMPDDGMNIVFFWDNLCRFRVVFLYYEKY